MLKSPVDIYLTGYDWVLLDPCYIAGKQTETFRWQWRDFFIKLGITDFFALKSVHLSFTQKQLVCILVRH